MKEKKVEVVLDDDKIVVVTVRELSWYEMRDVIDESTKIIDGKSQFMLGKLQKELVKRAIKDVEGIELKDKSNILKLISNSEGNKILHAVLELNPLEDLT